jgi:hypothetical protein
VKINVFIIWRLKVLLFTCYQVEDAVSRVAEGMLSAEGGLDFAAFRSRLGSLATVSCLRYFSYMLYTLYNKLFLSMNMHFLFRFFSALM